MFVFLVLKIFKYYKQWLRMVNMVIYYETIYDNIMVDTGATFVTVTMRLLSTNTRKSHYRYFP